MSEKTKVFDQNPLCLNLGCGSKLLPGWVNVDAVEEFNPDFVHDISQPLPIKDKQADEVKLDGVLEHFDKYMRFIVMYDWARVLKIGGKIRVGVPNVERMIKKFKKYGFENFVDTLFGENMLGSEVYIGHFGNHKWGYSEDSLKKFVSFFGIVADEVKHEGMQLILFGHKEKHISEEELDEHLIYAHANALGVGQSHLPLKFVKEKIKVFEDLQRKNSVQLFN